MPRYHRTGDEHDYGPRIVGEFKRPIWAPTPLDPFQLMKTVRDEEGYRDISYYQDAFTTVENVLKKNTERFNPPKHIARVMGPVVIGLLTHRFDAATGRKLPNDSDLATQNLFRSAQLAGAEPKHLFELLYRSKLQEAANAAMRPSEEKEKFLLDAVEVAKQTHPFDWNATEDMDRTVRAQALEFAENHDLADIDRTFKMYVAHVETTEELINHKIAAEGEALPTATLITKRAMGAIALTNGLIMPLVQRDCHLIDLAHPLTHDLSKHFEEWKYALIRSGVESGGKKISLTTPHSDKQVEMLRQKIVRDIESQLAVAGNNSGIPIYPAVRSYYVHVVDQAA